LDAGFGAGGVARHAPIRRRDARAVAVQPDGRIVLAGRLYKPGDAKLRDALDRRRRDTPVRGKRQQVAAIDSVRQPF
jgi:hypothetical protein